MKKQIIGIGGGGMSKNSDTYPIERYILQQSNKPRPNVCFMATATGDADRNIVRFYDVFSKFSCERTHLSLLTAPKDIEAFILKQDIIYVGGGNTKYLLALWREWNLDKILFKAYQNGVILSGFSAGSICWFDEGLSDYIVGELNPLKALGFIKGSHCPHFDSESARKPRCCELVASGALKECIAADDDVALHYIDGKLNKIVSASQTSAAYKIQPSSTAPGFQIVPLIPDMFL